MAFTEEQVAFVRANAGKLTNSKIGAQIGLTARQVRHIKDRDGMDGKRVRANYSPEFLETIRRMHVEQNIGGPTIAKLLGMTRYAVKGLLAERGWKRAAGAPHAPRAVKAKPAKARKVAYARPAARRFEPAQPAPRYNQAESEAIARLFDRPEAAPEPIPVKRGRQLARSARLVDIGGGVQVIRLKPVTDRIVAHCAPQARRGASVEDLAELFEVSPESLRHKLRAAGVEVSA